MKYNNRAASYLWILVGLGILLAIGLRVTRLDRNDAVGIRRHFKNWKTTRFIYHPRPLVPHYPTVKQVQTALLAKKPGFGDWRFLGTFFNASTHPIKLQIVIK